MVQIATFLDTTLAKANYANAAKALRQNGWTAVRNTAGNRQTIFYKYYTYLVNNEATRLGTQSHLLTPAQLAPLYAAAQADYGKYEMYVKNAPDTAHVVAVPAAAPPEEVFATDAEVAAMDPMFAPMEQLLALMGGLKMGGKKRRHTRRRKHSKRRHTRR
jgi:hypothetical protein